MFRIIVCVLKLPFRGVSFCPKRCPKIARHVVLLENEVVGSGEKVHLSSNFAGKMATHTLEYFHSHCRMLIGPLFGGSILGNTLYDWEKLFYLQLEFSFTNRGASLLKLQ